MHYGTEALANLKRVFRSRKFDLVFIQKGLLSTNLRGFDRLFRWANPKFVFDLDDAVYGRNIVQFRKPFLRDLQDENQTKKISASAAAVIAGNRYLQGLAQDFNPNVFLIPTPVDTRRFRPVTKKAKRNEITIGWIGVSGTFVDYFMGMEGILAKIARQYPVKLKIITRLESIPLKMKKIPLEMVNWTHETEVEEMADFDIGIMPLPDDPWTRGKCGLKLLQYMAMGIPSVASHVGMNGEIIDHGRDGFLVNKPEEWEWRLSELVEDALLRQRMGEAGRQKVVEKYSLEKTAPHLAQVLKNVSQN